MATGIAVLAALLAACCFGVAAVLQQAAARSAPEGESLRPRLLFDLARRPMWLAGVAMSVFSYAVQGLALAFGPLVLVQPLAATDLVFALPLLAHLHGTRLTRSEVAGIACTAGGVAAFLTVLPVTRETRAPSLSAWIPLLLVVGSLVLLLVPAGLRHSSRGPVRTGLYAAAAGVLFALLDALTKSTAELLRASGLQVVGHWEPYALLAVGGLGLLLAQSSFQAGSLAVSLPIIDTVEPIGSVVIGAVVFHERLAASTGTLTVQLLGALLAVAGIVVLDRSPLVHAH